MNILASIKKPVEQNTMFIPELIEVAETDIQKTAGEMKEEIKELTPFESILSSLSNIPEITIGDRAKNAFNELFAKVTFENIENVNFNRLDSHIDTLSMFLETEAFQQNSLSRLLPNILELKEYPFTAEQLGIEDDFI